MNVQSLARSKVGRLLGTLLLLTAIVGGAGWWCVRSLARDLTALTTENLQASVHLSAAENALWELRFALPNYMLQDVAKRSEISASADKFIQQAQDHLRAYGELPLSPEERRLLDEWHQSFSAYIRARPRYFELIDAGRLDEANVHRATQTNPPAAQAVHVLNSLITTQKQLGAEREVSAQRDATVATWVMLVVVAVALGLGVVLGYALTQQAAGAMRALGDSSNALGNTGDTLLSGARELSVTTTQVSGTLQELLVTSRQISGTAQEVATVARDTGESAERGNALVKRAQESLLLMQAKVDEIVQRMEELGRSSQEIGGITEIIRELTEQTNILSINASIEAAGAGAAGLRFGVVADEIRRLADRVGQSSHDIRELTDKVRAATELSVAATKEGAKTAEASTRHFDDVLSAFRQIAARVGDTTTAAHQIELSTRQQAAAVEQVTVAMSQLVQTAKATETSSQQMTATCEQLEAISRRLSEIAGTPGQMQRPEG